MMRCILTLLLQGGDGRCDGLLVREEIALEIGCFDERAVVGSWKRPKCLISMLYSEERLVWDIEYS